MAVNGPQPPQPLRQSVHILGIAGTFMGGLAQLAKAQGFAVSGVDQGVYPPMSEQLLAADITFDQDYAKALPDADNYVIGNAISRGNPAVELILREDRPFASGPQWLAQQVLHGRPVLAVAGTHGKSTTASMLAWMLECAGLEPGFLIGAVPQNFGVSARLGAAASPFVIEADEYDTAFFDKRSKFVHYRPRVCVLNNLEFDHADIYDDLSAIERQFHHLIRTVPDNGAMIVNAADVNLAKVLKMGCWSPIARFNRVAGWHVESVAGELALRYRDREVASSTLGLAGDFNASNALAAALAARAMGVDVAAAWRALASFTAPKRRQELLGVKHGIQIINDFAHHPTAIAQTVKALKPSDGRLIVALDLASQSMARGVYRDDLAAALANADHVLLHAGRELSWSLDELVAKLDAASVCRNAEQGLQTLRREARAGDTIVLMSNGSFDGLAQRLPAAL